MGTFSMLRSMKNRIKKRATKRFFVSNWVALATAFAGLFGIITGVVIEQLNPTFSTRQAMYVGFVGKLFLSSLKCLIIPLIVSSMITAVGTLDLKDSRKIGGRTIAYYVTTTTIAMAVGLLLVETIKPGGWARLHPDDHGHDDHEHMLVGNYSQYKTDAYLDLLRNLIPPNILQATLQQAKTTLEMPYNDTDIWVQIPEEDRIPKSKWPFKTKFVDKTNILGLVMWSTAIGIACAVLHHKARPVVKFCEATTDIMMALTQFVLYMTPLGVYFLVTEQVILMTHEHDVAELVAFLSYYVGTVLLGLCIHAFIILPCLYCLFVHEAPFKFIENIAEPLITAFATSSSSAVLEAIEALEEKNKLDPRVVRFVVPIGATINMDGTALYEAVAAIFISQYHDIEFDYLETFAIVLTATFASVGAACIPQAGFVTIIVILKASGLPENEIGLLLSVDWLLDRFRTTSNVLGDCIGAAIVNKLSAEDLKDKKALTSPHHKFPSNLWRNED